MMDWCTLVFLWAQVAPQGQDAANQPPPPGGMFNWNCLLMGLLHSLVNAVDAKDTYTCGHSERVALLSRTLAQVAGLGEQFVDRIYMAGLLHDVGKIGVPEAVLQKTGRLTPEEFEQIKKHRTAQRKSRTKRGVVQVAIMGYTNAGKSTLLNRLTKADVLAENKLFATLDPVTRKLRLPGGAEVLLTDTVGFIQRLPTQLVAAFRATLEEVTEADVLLHVLDASHPAVMEHVRAVREILEDLDCGEKPTIRDLSMHRRAEANAAACVTT